VQTDAQRRMVTVSVGNGTQRLADAVRVLDRERVPVAGLAMRRPTLDEIFLTLTGHKATPPANGSAKAKPAKAAPAVAVKQPGGKQ
jgi:hypothetical protein